jgi:hypothetical protein
MLMAVRMSIPLPGPFTVSASTTRNVTVWTHGGCHTKHRTERAAQAHAAALAARTPAQVGRAARTGLVIGWTIAGAFVAGIVTFIVSVIH